MNFICLDVANGYSQFFVEYVQKVRKAYPKHTIMVRAVIKVCNQPIILSFEKATGKQGQAFFSRFQGSRFSGIPGVLSTFFSFGYYVKHLHISAKSLRFCLKVSDFSLRFLGKNFRAKFLTFCTIFPLTGWQCGDWRHGGSPDLRRC